MTTACWKELCGAAACISFAQTVCFAWACKHVCCMRFVLKPVFANMVKHKVEEDTKKINYVKAALLGADRFVLSSSLDVDLHAALEWIADRHPTQVCARALGRLWRLFLLIGLVLRQRLSVQRPSVGLRSWPTVLCRAANATIGSQALIHLLPGHVRQGIVAFACVCACLFCCRHRAA